MLPQTATFHKRLTEFRRKRICPSRDIANVNQVSLPFILDVKKTYDVIA